MSWCRRTVGFIYATSHNLVYNAIQLSYNRNMLTDIIVIAIAFLFAVTGFSRGFIKSALSMVKISISVLIALLLCRPIATFLDNVFGLAGAFDANGELLLVAITALVIFITTRLLLIYVKRAVKRAKEEHPALNKVDSVLGFVFGILRFLFLFFIFSLVLYIITLIPFLDAIRVWIFGESTVAAWLYEIMTTIVFHELLGVFAGAVGM